MKTFEQLAKEAALWLPILVDEADVDPDECVVKVSVTSVEPARVLVNRSLADFLADLQEACGPAIKWDEVI